MTDEELTAFLHITPEEAAIVLPKLSPAGRAGEAMREPTAAMIEAAGADQNYADGGGLERHDFEEEYWRAIAEALK
jgi:hypothetical protein